MENNFGIKGFDENLKCKGYQFSIGKTHTEEVTPKLCGRGFHYCKTIKDVFSFYKNDGRNRFCLIEVLGDVDEGVEKSCTNKIKIVRELSKQEVSNGITDEFVAKQMKEMCDKGFMIGGSMALKIHGYKIDRPISDIDLVTKENDHSATTSLFKGMKGLREFSARDSICAFTGLLGEKYDVLKNVDARSVKRSYMGYELEVEDEVQIWEAKLRYALNGMVKHMDDILKNNIVFKMNPRMTEDNKLPF